MSLTEGSFSLLTESQPTKVPATGLLRLGEPFTNAADGRLWVGSTDTDSLEIGLNAKSGLIAETGKYLTRDVPVATINIPYDPTDLDEDEFFEFFILFNATADVVTAVYDKTVDWGSISDPLLLLSSGNTLLIKFFSYGFSNAWSAVPVWSNDSDVSIFSGSVAASQFYSEVQDASLVIQTQRKRLRFQGAAVNVFDDAGQDATVIDVTVGSGETYFDANSVAAAPSALGTDSLAIGPSVTVLGFDSVGLGKSITVNDATCIAIGDTITTGADGSAAQSIVIGNNTAVESGINNIAIGTNALLDHALGANDTESSIIIGHDAQIFSTVTSESTESIALGSSNVVNSSLSAISIGASAQAINQSDDSIIMGSFASMDGSTSAVGIGDGIEITNSEGAVGVGRNIDINTALYAVAIGDNADVTTAVSGIAIGKNSDTFGNQGISIGDNANSIGAASIAIGTNANITGTDGADSRILGPNNTIDDGLSTAFASSNSDMIIGSQSTISDSRDVYVFGDDNTITSIGDATILGEDNTMTGDSDGATSSNMFDNIQLGNTNVISDTTVAASLGGRIQIGKSNTNNGTSSFQTVQLGTLTVIGNSSENSMAFGTSAEIGNSAPRAVQFAAGTNSTPDTMQFLTNIFVNDEGIQLPTQNTGVAPVTSPAAGSAKFDTSNFILYIFDGAMWRSVTLT